MSGMGPGPIDSIAAVEWAVVVSGGSGNKRQLLSPWCRLGEQQLSWALSVLQAPQALHAGGRAQQGPPFAQSAAPPAAQLTQLPPHLLPAPRSAHEALPAAQAAAAGLPAAEPPALDVVDITEDGSSHVAAGNAAGANAGEQQVLVAQGGPYEARSPSAEGRPAGGQAPAAQGGQRQAAPQQQQGTSGRLHQPPVRAVAVGQAVTSPPAPPAAYVLQPSATPLPLWPTVAAQGPWSACAAPALQGTAMPPLRWLSAALAPQQPRSCALEGHHTAAPSNPVILQGLPVVEQVQSLATLRQAHLRYESVVEALLGTAEELQQLPGVQQLLHRMQQDVQVGACPAGCSCWSAGTAAEPASAQNLARPMCPDCIPKAPEPDSWPHFVLGCPKCWLCSCGRP